MPPFKPLGLQIITEDLQAPPEALRASLADQRNVRDSSWEVRPGGDVAMQGKSLRGDYVFSSAGNGGGHHGGGNGISGDGDGDGDGGGGLALVRAGGRDADARAARAAERDVVLVRLLGAGASGTVHKAYHTRLRRFVAVKRVSVASREARQQALRDVRVLCDAAAAAEAAAAATASSQQQDAAAAAAAAEPPGLVAFLGAFLVPQREQLALLLEYMDGGTLADLTRRLGRVPEAALARVARGALQGLAFMHAQRLVHRDVKPANLLLSLARGEAKLGDFGIAATVDHTAAQCHTYAGTVTYMSPERLESKPYGAAADVWALGLSLLEALTGRYPYDASAGPVQLIISVLHGDVPLPPPPAAAPAGSSIGGGGGGEGGGGGGGVAISDLARDFLSLCLQKDPARRPAARALLEHPWLARAAAAADLRQLLRQSQAAGNGSSTTNGSSDDDGGSSEEDWLEAVSYHFAYTYYELLLGRPPGPGPHGGSAGGGSLAAGSSFAPGGAAAAAAAGSVQGAGGGGGGLLDALAPLYLDHSALSSRVVCGGRCLNPGGSGGANAAAAAATATGRGAILAALAGGAAALARGGAWALASVDAQPLLGTGCVVVHAAGRARLPAPPPPHVLQQLGGLGAAALQPPAVVEARFAEAFVLARCGGGEYYVANQAGAWELLPAAAA